MESPDECDRERSARYIKKNIPDCIKCSHTFAYSAGFVLRNETSSASFTIRLRGVERRETRRGSTRFENRGTALSRRQATIITSCNESKRRLILTSWDDVQFQGDAASKSNLIVDIEPKRQTAVRLGESLQILCRVGRPLRVCRVEIPGEEGGMVLSKGQLPEDGIEYYGEGTEAGQCGVRIAKIKESHDGVFKCTLTTTESRAEAQASMTIIVAKPPNNPELHTSPGSDGRNIYRKGEKLEVSCSAPAGRPAANVSLFLDDEPIGNEERPTIYDSNVDDNSLAVQNASRILDWTDNGKVLRCIASHIALDRPKETTMQLQVYYPPQPQPTIERFGYVIGRQGVVNVTVYANPRPRFLWRVNNEVINEGRPDESNRLETSTATDLCKAESENSCLQGRGAWSVILTIDSVQKSDTEKEYVLEARNGEGAYEYRIILSTATEPAGVDLDAGSIIGIVVGALVLLLIVFILIFARATGRWCFA
ncbi:unnamed protein product, partial [Heterotrigona itama]